MQKNQVFNPYLPSYEYVPDAEPHIFDGRIYIYGSHDRFNGKSFCLNDYVCWSAPEDYLSDWRYEGVIYRKEQDPGKYKGIMNFLYAPDVCRGADGRFYLYYFIGMNGVISVAVCDTPAGKYEFLGNVKYSDGTRLGAKGEPLQFDPGAFMDDDGRVYLYTGFAADKFPRFLMKGHKPTKEGAMGFELESDMITIKSGPCNIGVPAKACGKGTPYEGHEFFEAASMRKFNGRYYFIYSSVLGHELCYAVSDNPLGSFSFGGTLISNGDIGLNGRAAPRSAANFTGNTHGSLLKTGGRYFVFYHRQTNKHQFSRQACAEEIYMRADGGFDQAEMTSCGLNGGPLTGNGEYSAAIACNLYSKKGARFYSAFKGLRRNEPYITQTGKDRESDPCQYIADISDGTVIGYKYFCVQGLKQISVQVKGNAAGMFIVSSEPGGTPAARITLSPCKEYKSFSAALSLPDGASALFFQYCGKGRFDFFSFELL